MKIYEDPNREEDNCGQTKTNHDHITQIDTTKFAIQHKHNITKIMEGMGVDGVGKLTRIKAFGKTHSTIKNPTHHTIHTHYRFPQQTNIRTYQ